MWSIKILNQLHALLHKKTDIFYFILKKRNLEENHVQILIAKKQNPALLTLVLYMEIGENGQDGAIAMLLVEMDIKPDQDFVTVQSLKMEALNVQEKQQR